jgi:hypothetical protein
MPAWQDRTIRKGQEIYEASQADKGISVDYYWLWTPEGWT